MKRTFVALVTLSMLLSGCSYVHATSLYRGHPELRPVQLATGQNVEHPEAVGLAAVGESGIGERT